MALLLFAASIQAFTLGGNMIRAPSLAIASRRPTVAMYDEASWTAALENVNTVEPKLRTSKQSNAVKNALAAALTAGMLIAAPSNVKPAMAAPTTVAAPPTVSRSAAKRPSAARRTAAQDEGSLTASEQAAGAPPLPKGYAVGNVLNLVDPRKTGGRIVDNAQMFGSDGSLRSQEAQADITKAISKVEAEVEGSQILVVTVPSTPAGKSHKQFATELFNSWRVGSYKTQNGVLIVVFKNDRHLEIEVGVNLEDSFTREYTEKMIKKQIIPQFKDGFYKKGIIKGIDSIGDKMQGGDGGSKATVGEMIALPAYLAMNVLGALSGGGGASSRGSGGSGGSSDYGGGGGGYSSGGGGGGGDW